MKHKKNMILSTAVLLFLACERDTKLTVEGGDPPKFIMTGSGRLGTAPPPLSEDEGYSVRAITMNANGAFLKFAIHKGEVIVDPVMRNGKPEPSPPATHD